MEPGFVWLNLIHLFSMFWMNWTVIKIRDSLQKEYEERYIEDRKWETNKASLDLFEFLVNPWSGGV